jgi:hypothetical protein
MEITVNKDGQDLGPYSLEELQAELAAGNLSPEDHAWHEGCEDWICVSDVPGIGDEQSTQAESAGGIHLEKGGPFPLAQVQGMLNQGALSMEDAAWLDGWDDWGTLADVPGLKKPRVRVAGGSPLSGLTPASDADETPQKAKKNKNAEESGKGKRSRKKKAKKKSGSLVQRLMPLLLLVILAAAGFGGFLIYKRMVEGDTVEDIFKNPTAKEDPPPIDDPWAYTEWRTKRQR